MYERWQRGEPKSKLEIEYFDKPTAHLKAFTAYVRKWLKVETEKKSSQTSRIAQMEGLLRANGISPGSAGDLAEEYRLLAKSRESALAALRTYNDPTAGFRTESFILLMIVAWNSLLQAKLETDKTDYYERDEAGRQILIDGRPKVRDTSKLIEEALPGAENSDVRANLDFFLGLRNQVAHRYLPALDLEVAGEAQALLLNYEETVAGWFGEEAALGAQLTVPLQLSGFRPEESLESLRKAQARLPIDVLDFLNQHRIGLNDDVLLSPRYCLNVFFVPVVANRERLAHAVVRYLQPGTVTLELESQLQDLGVVTKRRITPVASGDLYRPGEVVNLVSEQLPYRFTMDTHTRCWKYYSVRPPTESGEPEATDDRYCRWDRLSGGYGYTKAWVERLVKKLSDHEEYVRAVGFPPDRR